MDGGGRERILIVYVCRPEFESILCGVYDAWMSRLDSEHVRLELEGEGDGPELFCQYRRVKESREKADRTFAAVGRLSRKAAQWIYQAALSDDPGRADAIYRFLVQAFRLGPGITDRLQLPEADRMFRLCRQVSRESHHIIEFIRFSQTAEGILLSRIAPKGDLLTLISPHFADRLPEEGWIIYDEGRRKASVHRPGGPWALVRHPLEEASGENRRMELNASTDEMVYADLWRTFYDAVAIRERENPKCQNTHLPLRFRPYMTEFDR